MPNTSQRSRKYRKESRDPKAKDVRARVDSDYCGLCGRLIPKNEGCSDDNPDLCDPCWDGVRKANMP